MDSESSAARAALSAPFESEPWQIARNRFLQDSSPEERLLFASATTETLYYDTSNTEREDRKKSRMRNRLQKIQPLVDKLEEYGQAMDVYANAASWILAPLWGSIRVVLVLAQSYNGFLKTIEVTLGKIGDSLPRFKEYQRLFPHSQHPGLTEALSVVYLDIITLCMEFRALIRSQTSSSINRLVQPLRSSLKSKCKAALDRFGLHKENVEKTAQICHMIEECKERQEARASRELQVTKTKEASRLRLLGLLSGIDNECKHERIRKVKHANSCTWLYATEEYRTWDRVESSSILCCHGIPGCGKTVIASSVIDILMEPSELRKLKVVYHYCDYTDKRTLEPILILGSLVRGLLEDFEIPEQVADLIAAYYHHGKRVPEAEEVLDIFLRTLESFENVVKNVIIAIDGIDEVNEVDFYLILGYLRTLMARPAVPVKLFISCREDVASFVSADRDVCLSVIISDSVISHDIDDYIQHSVELLCSARRLAIKPENQELKEGVIEVLRGGAKGMFLLVKFQLDELELAVSEDTIKARLRNLPKDLNETYERLLHRVTDCERQDLVKRMFEWIIAARRSLTIDEICEGIAFTIEDRCWDPKKIPTDLLRIIRACGSLVVIDEETQITQLAHYTVQQYLLDKPSSTKNYYHFNMQEANEHLGEVCIAYLNFSDFERQVAPYLDNGVNNHMKVIERVVADPTSPMRSSWDPMVILNHMRHSRDTSRLNIDYNRYTSSRTPRTDQPLDKKYSLLRYARGNWLRHTAMFQSESTIETRKDVLFHNLVTQRQLPFRFKPWPTDVSLKSPYPELTGWALNHNHPGLVRILSKFDSAFKFKSCFEDAANWFFDGMTGTCITDTQLKLERHFFEDTWDPQFPVQGWLYCRMLIACRQGNLAVMDLCQPDLNKERYPWRQFRAHLMIEAAASNQNAIFDFFPTPPRVDDDFRLFTTFYEGEKRNALERAALAGYPSMVYRLGQAGWRASNLFGGQALSGIAALDAAIHEANSSIVGALLRALEFATTNPPSALTNGQKVEIIMTAFLRAVATGNAAIVKSFPAERIDPLCPNRTGMCPYMQAIKDGHTDIFCLFVLEGCNAEENASGLPLGMAASHGRLEIAQMLVSIGAIVIPHDPMNYWFQRSDMTWIQGSDLTSPTPLYAAAANGHEAVVEYLLTQGAGINILSPRELIPNSRINRNENHVHGRFYSPSQDPTIASIDVAPWQRPLGGAALNGHVGVVLIFLEAKALVNLSDVHEESTLLLAAIGGHGELVRLLRTAGAELGNRANAEKHFLAYAMNRGPDDALRLLLELGVSPNCINSSGESGLHHASAQGLTTVMRQLIDAGANIEVQNQLLRTPLMYACSNDQFEAASVLIAAGVNVSAKDRGGDSALSFASTCGNIRIAQLLLENKAPIDSLDVMERTPLFQASQAGNHVLVQALLSRRANIEARARAVPKSPMGCTPLMIATLMNRPSVITILCEAGARTEAKDWENGRTSLLLAAESGHDGALRCLVKAGASLKAQCSSGHSVLHYATEGNSVPVAKYLLDLDKSWPRRRGALFSPEQIDSARNFGHRRHIDARVLQVLGELIERNEDPMGSVPLPDPHEVLFE